MWYCFVYSALHDDCWGMVDGLENTVVTDQELGISI